MVLNILKTAIHFKGLIDKCDFFV